VTDPDEQRKPINWGTEIKKLREGQNMAQRRLAKLAGVDRASLRRFEEGDSRGCKRRRENPSLKRPESLVAPEQKCLGR
jgi:transcriptional regulator with XRE-family HTH domain